MANDPNTIQYVIQEDGFWYIASKDRTPGVPEITVSAKGVANGLSTEYNDGYDFGPDSYNPSVTSGVALTQSSGIQEAINYVHAQQGGKITLSPGRFTLSADLPLTKVVEKFEPFVSYYGPLYSYLSMPTVATSGTANAIEIDIEGSGGLNQPSQGGIGITFGNNTIIDATALNPQTSPAYYNSIMYTVLFSGGGSNSSIISNLIVLVNSPFLSGITISGNSNVGKNVLVQNMNGLPPASVYDNPNDSTVSTGATEPFQWGFYIDAEYGVCGTVENVQANYFDTGIILGSNINAIQISSNICRNGLGLTGDFVPRVGTFVPQVISNSTISLAGYLNGTVIIGTILGTDNTSAYGDQQDIICETGTYHQGIEVQSFHMETPNQTVSPRLPYIKSSNFFPYPSSFRFSNLWSGLSQQIIDGTTAGTINMTLKEYGNISTKYILALDGYENDTTTNQAITFPIAFLTAVAVMVNTTGLTIAVTTTGITITSPDATTTYSGIIVIEGY